MIVTADREKRLLTVAGASVEIPGVLVTQGRPFVGLPDRRRTTALVVHETVTRSAADTHRVLERRGLSVHLVGDERGTLIQHADLVARAQHAGPARNACAVGLEVVSPYYPKHARAPWGASIDAPWAHEGRYLLPTRESAEACARWIVWQTSDACPELVRVPRVWAGLAEGMMAMGRVSPSPRTGTGILAHTYFGHADGAWLVLYAWLRIEAKLDVSRAYDEAVRRATGVRRVDVRDLVLTPA